MKPISIWEGTAGAGPHFPTLKGSLEADAVIIGGGITGLTAAMLLQEAGKNVVLLESHRIGMGTTGNSTGNLYATVDEHLSGIRKKWSPAVMKTVVKSRTAAMNLIRDTVKRLSIDCDLRETTFNYFAGSLTDDINDFILQECEALEEAGLKAGLVSDPGLPFEVKKAITVSGQAQFHPLKYARGLAAALDGKCRIYEHSQVIEANDDTGIVKTHAGSVKAEHILMATHTPKGIYMVQTMLGAYREHGIASELKSGSCPDGIFWSLDQPKHSIRSHEDSGKQYVMVIGDKYKTGHEEHGIEYIQKLESFLGERFDVGATRYVWGGQQYSPVDSLPYIGKHGKTTYFMTGYATDGLVYGTLAAMIVSDRVTGRSNAWEETFRASRFTPVKSAGDFIKENTDVMLQYLKDLPWSMDSGTLRGIRPGQAKIIAKDGGKLAVYKDEKGENHIVSAVCTHMKCVVNWNEAEKSWDCPCHGSRFSIDGKVLEGPALHDLPLMKKP